MINVLKPLIKQFLPFAQEKMGFEHPPNLFLKQDASNASNPLGKTAFYDPQQTSITLFITDRHPKDVMRSLSHELVHHTQNCNGELENPGEMGEGYAQNNEHMREMERQAYEMGNMCFRDWEDSIKGTIYNESLQKGVKENMSTKNWKDNELKSLLAEAWGFKMDLSRLTEGKDYDDPGASGTGSSPTGDPEDEEEAGKKETEGEEKSKRGINEEELEESWADDDAGGYQRKYEKERGIRKKGYSSSPDSEKKKKKKEDLDEELFEQATMACKRRHDLQGDKAIRECIEEEMTRMVNEGFGEGEPAKDEWSKKQEIYMEEDEELEERHKPDNVRQGREPGRRRKNVNTGQKSVDEKQVRHMVRQVLKTFKESKR
jgi:hypothetical protein